MPFSQRNIFYLRTSSHVVLQTILYIDPKHLKWMNSYAHTDEQNNDDEDDEGFEIYERDHRTGDLVWSRALSRLKSKIMPKLRSESMAENNLSSTNTKEKVDTHIEPDFQMAYFFRKISGKHAVLLKQKELKFPEAAAVIKAPISATTTTSMPPPALPASANINKSKSKAKDSMPASRLAERQENQLDNVVSLGDSIANEELPIDGDEDVKPPKSRMTRDEIVGSVGGGGGGGDALSSVRVKTEDEDVQLHDDENLNSTNIERLDEAIDVDAMVDDKKPRLHVKYSGFKIFGKCFIVVIEPTKRTKRLRSSLFQTSAPIERHQLSSTPVPRQARETPVPTSVSDSSLSNRRSLSLSRSRDEMEEDEEGRQDSRKSRLSAGLFRGSPSEWTPTPTPEPERRLGQQRRNGSEEETGKGRAAGNHSTGNDYDDGDGEEEDDDNEEEDNLDESTSVMLATQMLEGGIAGQGNDIDDD